LETYKRSRMEDLLYGICIHFHFLLWDTDAYSWCFSSTNVDMQFICFSLWISS